ncbi:MAG: hypothetical protein IJP29_05970 [Lachnospiraceae bacterium]|nr:hypothetical protein [Lachnospiraceae bacterium]
MKKGIICFVILMSALFVRIDAFAMEIETRVVNGVSFEEYIVDHLKRRETRINVFSYGIGTEECGDLYRKVLYKHPELYYVLGNCPYVPKMDYTFDLSTGSLEVVQEDVVDYISPRYLDYGQTDEEWVFEQMDKPLAFIDEDMTDMEKALFIHDYMCINLVYGERNTDVPEYHNIMGYILEGKAVCEGYAKVFQYYMNKLGIPSRIMLGDVEEGYHAWNEVQIDRQWYMVDVTHDDPIPDEYGRVMHTHFLKSETGIGDRTWEKEGYQPCTSTKYDDAFWDNVETQMIYRDGSWYYINGNDEEDMNLYRHDFVKHSLTEKGDVCVELTDKWMNYAKMNSYWIGSYGKIAQYEDNLLYSTPTRIFQYSFDDKRTKCIIRETVKNQSIYGMRVTGDYLLYQVGEAPDSEQQEIAISMKQLPLSVGTVVKDEESKAFYQVVCGNRLGGTVLYKKSLKCNAASVVVPESISIDGRDYRVIGIAKKAFANQKKRFIVTLPSTIKSEMEHQRKRHYLIKTIGAGYEITRN